MSTSTVRRCASRLATQHIHSKGAAPIDHIRATNHPPPRHTGSARSLLRHATPLLRHAVVSPWRNVVIAHNVVVGAEVIRAKAVVCSAGGGCKRSEAVRRMGCALRQLALP